MAIQPIPLASKAVDDRPNSPERLVNMFVEQSPEESRPMTIRSHAGLRPYVSHGTGPIRGLFEHKGSIWLISGEELYQSGNPIPFGAILGLSPCRTSPGLDHVMIASDIRTYILDTSGALPALIEAAPERWNLQDVAWLDGRWIILPKGTATFLLSDLDSPYTFNPLGFVTAEAYNDEAVALLRDAQELWVFGERSLEYWRSSGSAVPTMDRVGFFERGCLSPRSPALFDSNVFWVADDRTVRVAAGYQPEKVSTPWVDQRLSGVDLSEVEGFIYVDRGHPFYAIVLSGNSALLFDLTTRLWSERETFQESEWKVRKSASLAGNYYIGSAVTGEVYLVDGGFYKDGALSLRREATFPPISFERQRARVFLLEVDANVGEIADPGASPSIMMDYSEDGGYVWSNEVPASFGSQGQYLTLLHWRRLGQTRRRVFRLACADDVAFELYGARVDVQ